MLPCHLSPKGISWKESQRPPEPETTGMTDKHVGALNGTKWEKLIIVRRKEIVGTGSDGRTEDPIVLPAKLDRRTD
jgi:hypothetical protein